MSLECNLLGSLAKMDIGSSKNANLFSNLTKFHQSTCDSSSIHCCNIETWNTRWMAEKVGGNANTYYTSLTTCRISKGPIYLGLSLPLLLNLITPFKGNTHKKTLSPTLNLNEWRLWSSYLLGLLWVLVAYPKSPKINIMSYKENLRHEV